MKKKSSIILATMVIILLALVIWVISPISGRGIDSIGVDTVKLVYPDAIINEEVKVTIAKRESTNVISSKDTEFVKTDQVNGSDDTQEIRQFAETNADKFDLDPWKAIESKLIADGVSPEGFIRDQGYDYQLNKLKGADIPSYVYIELKKSNSEGLIVQNASVLLVRRASDGKYLAIGVQYSTIPYNESYNYKRKQGVITDLSQLTVAQGFLQADTTCIYQKTTYDEVNTPSDQFECDDKKGVLLWRFSDPSKEYTSPDVKKFGFYTLSKCSIGSLWQQFSCKYLGQ